MSEVLIKVINLSLSAIWLILAVILLRAILKKAPKWFPCALWAIVAIRLIVPFSIESATSVIPSSEPIPAEIVSMDRPQVNSGITYVNNVINPIIERVVASPVEKTSVVNLETRIADASAKTETSAALVRENGTSAVNKAGTTVRQSGITMQSIVNIASIVWISGIVILLGYALVGAWRLRRRIAASIQIEEGVLCCDEVKSPFIFGIFRPKIYVPSSMNEKTLSYVLAHERAHLSRWDHLWKPLGFVLLAVYWFNPLSWVAYILLCRDIEMACDEKVVHNLEKTRAADYTQALLDCSTRRISVAACPLAFGEIGVKQRVKNVLGYKKPKYAIVVLLIVACGIVSGCFLTSPKKENVDVNQHGTAHASPVKYAFNGFSVELKNAYFNGTAMSIDYEIIGDKDTDFATIATQFSIEASGKGKLMGMDLTTPCLCSKELFENIEYTRLYRMSGDTQEPVQSIELKLKYQASEYTYTLPLTDDARITVITPDKPDKIDTSDWGKNVEYITNLNMKGFDEHFSIERVVISDNGCALYWNDTSSEIGYEKVEKLQKIYKDGGFYGVLDEFRETQCFITLKKADVTSDEPTYSSLRVAAIRFMNGASQDTTLEMLKDAEFRMSAKSNSGTTTSSMAHAVSIQESS